MQKLEARRQGRLDSQREQTEKVFAESLDKLNTGEMVSHFSAMR